MAVDVSGVSYFLPIIGFLLVFVVIFAFLNKTKIFGEHLFVQLLVAFLVAIIFVSSLQAREYVKNIATWTAILIISLAFLLLIMGIVGKDMSFMFKGVGIIFVIILILVFIFSAINVFSSQLGPYIPGTSSYGQNSELLPFFHWLYSSRVMGAILLLIVAGLVSWVLARGK